MCVFGGGLWSNPDSCCREGGDPKLELSKDKRKLLSLVLKGAYCSFDSEDRSGLLAVVLTSLDPPEEDFRLLSSRVLDPKRGWVGRMPSEFLGSEGIPVLRGLCRGRWTRRLPHAHLIGAAAASMW